MGEQEYINQIKNLTNPTFQQIRNIAYQSISYLTDTERSKLYEALQRGVKILETHEELCQYLLSFGNMHEAKIHFVVDKLPKELFESGYEIIDWGCGQGIATICFFDYLKEKGLPINVERVTLIEPGKKALERAKLHIAQYISENKIQTINKYFEQVEVDEIKTEGKPVIHFFSNILDIQDIDLKELAEKLSNSLTTDNYIVTVGPTNATNKRIDWFYEKYFKNTELLLDIEDRYFPIKPGKIKTLKAKVYKLEYNEEGNLIPIEFYPPVQFYAAYQLDIIRAYLAKADDRVKRIYKKLTAFEVSAPFDIGANVYDDVHPILAVLNNIVTRGLPTKASPYIEEKFRELYNLTVKNVIYGEIIYEPKKKIDIEKYLTGKIDLSNLANEEKIDLELIFSPILISRIQKTIIEAVLTNKLDINKDKWKILAEEKDIPGTALAIEDLKRLFNNLCVLSQDYSDLKFPEVELTIVSNEQFCNSKLHLNNNVYNEPTSALYAKEYDLVLDIEVFNYTHIDKSSFSKYKALNKCYFNIRSTKESKTKRAVYTTDRIQYKELVKYDKQGRPEPIKELKEILIYFLQLLFRKEKFRDGQLPILHRALQNKPVIGLLPTGGGKSLTYQLAAMLQPGVTVVIDPLKSLMQDQYDGLLNYGIDNCSYINSSLTREEREKVEADLEHSNLLFIFLSPERLAIYNFRERLKNMEQLNVYFSYGVIDEVHCVSEWGHDFRFTYLHLGRNLYNYVKPKTGHISLFGLTATASFDVLADVERELSGNGAFPLDAETIVRHENTNRLELQYKIEKVNVDFKDDGFFDPGHNLDPSLPRAVRISDKWTFHNAKKSYLYNYINKVPAYIRELQKNDSIKKIKEKFIERINLQDEEEKNKINSVDLKVDMPDDFYVQKEFYKQAGIVFCPHKNNTGISVNENVTSLNAYINDIGKFYGGDDNDDFIDELNAFRENRKPLMVATKAFGMGIDKPNVRFTINMNYSSSLESFVQEAGRAGRDRKMALSVIFISDYKLVRISRNYPGTTFPLAIIKGKWFKPEDLDKILNFYNLSVEDKYLDYLTPEKDLVRITCNEGTHPRYFGFANCNDVACPIFNSCVLRQLPAEAENWQYEKDLLEILKQKDLYIPKKYFQYQNADYETVMYFYNENFKGPIIEKRNMIEILNKKPIKAFFGNDAEIKSTFDITGFLDTLSNEEINKEIVSLVKYVPDDVISKIISGIKNIEAQNAGKPYNLPINVRYGNNYYALYYEDDIVTILNDIVDNLKLNITVSQANYRTVLNNVELHSETSIEKAIYRMTSIGLIEDFTQDYSNNQFRIVSTRHKEGEYYKKLQEYLERYFSKERAIQEVEEAKKSEITETDNALKNEIYRCLKYLTDFIYDKIATKRKRAIDDMRDFCLIGIDETKDWKIINEELKDYLYYYFNSKYARHKYETITGEGYSLTDDTDGGKIDDYKIVFKYLKVIEDDFIENQSEPGSTAIDNAKHLQGAVKLIRRSLTDNNPVIYLLNAFCLAYLGTRNNENLEQELEESYKDGMIEFYNRQNDKSVFWNKIFFPFNEKIKNLTIPDSKLEELMAYVLLHCHGKELETLTEKYIK